MRRTKVPEERTRGMPGRDYGVFGRRSCRTARCPAPGGIDPGFCRRGYRSNGDADGCLSGARTRVSRSMSQTGTKRFVPRSPALETFDSIRPCRVMAIPPGLVTSAAAVRVAVAIAGRRRRSALGRRNSDKVDGYRASRPCPAPQRQVQAWAERRAGCGYDRARPYGQVR